MYIRACTCTPVSIVLELSNMLHNYGHVVFLLIVKNKNISWHFLATSPRNHSHCHSPWHCNVNMIWAKNHSGLTQSQVLEITGNAHNEMENVHIPNDQTSLTLHV